MRGWAIALCVVMLTMAGVIYWGDSAREKHEKAVEYGVTHNKRTPVKPVAAPANSSGGNISITTADMPFSVTSGSTLTTIKTGALVDDKSCVHCDPISQTVGDIVRSRLSEVVDDDGDVGVWIDGDYSDWSKAKYTRHLAAIEKMIKWADGLPTGSVRSAYLGTLEFYEGNTQQALTEVTTQVYRKHMAEVDRKAKECEAIAVKFNNAHKIPLPPD